MGYIVMCAHLIKIGHLESKIYRFHFTWAYGRQAEQTKWNRLLTAKAQSSGCFYGAFIAPTMWSETCERAVAVDTVCLHQSEEEQTLKNGSWLHQFTSRGRLLDRIEFTDSSRDLLKFTLLLFHCSCCFIFHQALNQSAVESGLEFCFHHVI